VYCSNEVKLTGKTLIYTPNIFRVQIATDNGADVDQSPRFFPPSDSDVGRVFLERADADTFMSLPEALVRRGGQSTVSLHMFWRPEQTSTDAPQMLANYTVFGVPIEAPWYAPATRDTVEHKLDRLSDMSAKAFEHQRDGPVPAYTTKCSFVNTEANWSSHGLCFFFSVAEDDMRNARRLYDDPKQAPPNKCQHHVSASLQRVEDTMLQLARQFQQPAVFKWWPHRWGGRDQHTTTTVMQSLIPSRDYLQELKLHGPSRIRE
jgi:hypothetical protein